METPYVLKTLTPDQLTALSQEVKRVLTDLYGDRLNRVVLFGSYARGDFHEESDVDYMVVLNDEEVKSGSEIWFMSDKIGDLSLAYNILVSTIPTSLKKYQTSNLFMYQNVRREGKVL